MRALSLSMLLMLALPVGASVPSWDQVRPILVNRCLECHGGDRVKSGLRFATFETFAAGGDRGPVIDRDHPERSRFLKVISYKDPALAMPPTGELPPEEQSILVEWLRADAPWPEGPEGRLADPDAHPEEVIEVDADWWAYLPLQDPPVPSVSDRDWAGHSIDAFIEARRQERGLRPADPASPDQLYRRLSHVLTGLPAVPEELDEFLVAWDAEARDEVWSRTVDRFLASPDFGEHWARHWLDQVRYAETNGYERDGTKRNMWRYRDYVIRAFNENKPYDQFVVEQLAGDELARELNSDDPALRIATGFYRLGVWDDEPADARQALADETADIVDTVGQTLMGTTLGCARCHDHKKDPISQADYFAVTAFFSNLSGYGGGAFGQHRGPGMTQPVADTPGPGVLTVAERAALVKAVDDDLAPLMARAEEAAREAGALVEDRVLIADAREKPTTWSYTLEDPPAEWIRPGFDASGWKEGPAGFGRKGTPGAIVGTPWENDRIFLRTTFRLEQIPDALVLSIIHDEDAQVFVNGQPVFQVRGYRGNYLEVQLDGKAIEALVVGRNVVAVHCRQTGGGQSIDVGLRTGWLEGGEDRTWRVRLAKEADRWLEPESAKRARELLSERERRTGLPVSEPYPAQVVTEVGGKARIQHVHLRGSVHAPGDPVEPAVPVAFREAGGQGPSIEPVPADTPTTGRRLAFARWLVGDGEFISARVMANRMFQFTYGRGLCRSPGDFGRLGVEPTHPELLDHLATELIERDWSVKSMLRYLLSTRTFAMNAVGGDAERVADPRNDLFWRFEPRRLTAEEFRDGVLAVSGKLTRKLHGPSVYPPLPPEVTATASRPGAAWGKSSEEDANRRSVYVFVKRSLRPPMLEGLDQPDPDLPCPERFPTNIPTQALMLLNDPFMQESARFFARRLEAEAKTLDERLARGLRLALGRASVDEDELARTRDFIASLKNKHGLTEERALELFCLSLFNLNEFMWLD